MSTQIPKTLDGTLAFLYGLQKSGMKFGLRNTRVVLSQMGNPECLFRSIHIAGSNGKGSTAAMIASVLSACGYRTGLYTSPHLISFSERIRIDGVPISPADIVRLTRRIRPAIVGHRLTFFEAVTVLAFCYFSEKKIDFAVVETGLGGRLDATNVINPVISVITTIGKEHTEILGNLIGKIAYEKAGIIKQNVPCVIGPVSRTARVSIRRVALSKGAPLLSSQGVHLKKRSVTLKGSVFDAWSHGWRLDNVKIDLPGMTQIENARTCLRTLFELRDRRVIHLTNEHVHTGFSSIRRRTGLRARLMPAGQRPRIILDVAHNPAAFKRLASELSRLGIRNVFLVFGVMKEKAYRSIVRTVQPLTRQAYLVQPRTGRARPVADLEAEFRKKRVRIAFTGTVENGFRLARRDAGRRGTVLVTGSHFVVAEVMAYLEGKKYLTINQ